MDEHDLKAMLSRNPEAARKNAHLFKRGAVKPSRQAEVPCKPPTSQRVQKPVDSSKKQSIPTYTEKLYYDTWLKSRLESGEFDEVLHEGHCFEMANTHTYRVDWACFRDGVLKEVVEVKGTYRFREQGGARLAFDQCRLEFPGIVFVWAVKVKKKLGAWKIARY